MTKRLFTALAVAGTLAIAAPMLAGAQGSPDSRAEGPRAGATQGQDGAEGGQRMHRHERMHRMHGHERMHREHGRHHAHGDEHGGDAMGGYGFGPRMLRGLDLSEAQRDRLFEVRHAEAPAMREQGKIVREAHRELRALSMSDAYDDAKAREIIERGAKAMAEMARLRARSGNELWKLLTPEQREKLAERASHGNERSGERGGERNPGKGSRS